MKFRTLLFTLVMITALSAQAEGGVRGFLKKVGTTIDSMTIRGLDRRYIEMPEKPWQIILQSNINQSDLKMSAVLDGKKMFDDTWGDINWEPRIKTDVSSYVGLWAGYRGYGLGYSKDVSGNGSIFKLGMIGGAYGLSFRIHKFRTDEPSVHLSGYIPTWEEYTYTYPLFDPIKVRLLTFDGYYLFNGSRFSYMAAYDQSVIQRRSAGSLMAGAMYYHSTIAYDEGLNADFIMFMNDIGKMKQYQVSLGGGYAYNLVPCKGLLISGLGMLMLTAYNRLDVWRYNSNLRQQMIEMRENPDYHGDEIDYNDVSDEQQEELIRNDYSVWPMEQDAHIEQHSRVIPVIDARLSVTYNIGNWFFNVNAQLNDFRFKHDSNKGSLTDWYVNASVGIRL